MVKTFIRRIISLIEWFMYKLIGPKQREFFKNKLTDKQKHFIKKFMFSGKWQRQEIGLAKHRLYNLGFTKRAFSHLQDLSRKKDEPYLSRLANWELALWHANLYSKEDARKCLDLLQQATHDEKDPARLRQKTIMEAECYEILGDILAAKQVLAPILDNEEHPDVYLAAANLESDMSRRMDWINKALQLYNITPITLDEEKMGNEPAYDCIVSERKNSQVETTNTPKVTVIVPVYNAEDVIHTSLDAILSQTWTNLEVLVVDDCSKDSTVNVVEEYVKQDSRIRLIKAEKNGGAYVARNLALQEATGDFVTINDADDWSHSEKIEIQVRHLMKNPEIIGNTSQQARATNDLKFYRRGKPGTYIFSNMSSFLFRRKEVMEKLGFWHCVRFAADSEFIRRIKKVFGEKAIVELPTGPLSFQRQTSTSLTGNSAFGYHGYKMGVRREYEESHDYFHQTSENLYYGFPEQTPPFAVPEPMWPIREEKPNGYRHFDVIYASDFRADEQTVMTEVKEIRSLIKKGLRIGLAQLFQYELSPDKKVNRIIRDLLNGDTVQMVVYGEKITCHTLMIRRLPVLKDWQKYIPEVKTDDIRIVVDQLSQPNSETASNYINQCEKHLKEYFGKSGIWYPQSPNVRKVLQNDVNSVTLSNKAWNQGELIIEKQ
ncbi:hypothetical protein BKP45_03370 [Anaerobacillus alkalidiazotrophicus]|uniref:Glycosyltransferase 2-like domain-containing protein n=1 Tax=Anaerobacillus alkalidiazotrophicus TaxID=472963 RepID=A0A1S2MAJ3_9BACI|nr:glycosyltransferase family A protein [Anaerobacillus alkalidiazotrophicus]OIJ21751.1 hypothetical protein BKP45_03370 [Anaerobacillus alkalidiazotrophicus]